MAGYQVQAFGLSAWCSGVISGACCFEDGHCTTTAEVSCGTGDWRAEVPCDPNPCPQPPPTGACCRPNGTCTITTEAECGDLWLGPDTVCSPNPCPQPPTGACCYPDGQCLVRTQANCPTGDWREGVPCAPNPCPLPPPEGACCYPGGFCTYSTESDCPTGDWREGVGCDPNPCPTSGGYINEGGVLVVHDTGLTYTTDSNDYPSDPPPSCDDIDNAAPVGVPSVWKVYAAFPDENFPRLKALTFGETFDPGTVFILGAGLPNAMDFEIAQNGWPNTPGGGVGISFYQTLTGRISEVYWFGGYGYQGSVWSTAPHPVQATEFADDYTPPHVVPIEGLGSIGFGIAGETPCGSQTPSGACCFASGACMLLPSSNCTALGGVFVDGSCTPNPCPQPAEGACCEPDGQCVFTTQANCSTGDWREGVPCEPNPCPQPPEGACCFPDGSCEVMTQFACATGDWREGVPCDPNPCPEPPPAGACCHANGSCTLTSELDCGDLWLGPETTCSPNPCPQPPTGACCYPNGQCIVQAEVDCPTGDWREGIPCTPNPCPMPPPSGACCYGTSCVMASEGGCLGIWLGDGTDCDPNPCCRGPVAPPAGTRDANATTSAGSRSGIASPSTRDNPCPPANLYLNHDGTTENAFTWQHQGVIPPDFGAFAEGYLGFDGEICGAELLLTRWGVMSGSGTIDLYIWDYDQVCDIPGNVLSVTTPVQITGVAAWPGVSAFDIPIGDVSTGGWGFFVGYWPRSFEGVEAQFGCAMDENGPGGFPCTNIAPGLGYPTGWHHLSAAGYATQALGLGGWLHDWSVPVEKTTWGRIKAMYH